jgi:hypothetical protein
VPSSLPFEKPCESSPEDGYRAALDEKAACESVSAQVRSVPAYQYMIARFIRSERAAIWSVWISSESVNDRPTGHNSMTDDDWVKKLLKLCEQKHGPDAPAMQQLTRQLDEVRKSYKGSEIVRLAA